MKYTYLKRTKDGHFHEAGVIDMENRQVSIVQDDEDFLKRMLTTDKDHAYQVLMSILKHGYGELHEYEEDKALPLNFSDETKQKLKEALETEEELEHLQMDPELVIRSSAHWDKK